MHDMLQPNVMQGCRGHLHNTEDAAGLLIVRTLGVFSMAPVMVVASGRWLISPVRDVVAGSVSMVPFHQGRCRGYPAAVEAAEGSDDEQLQTMGIISHRRE